MFIRAPERGIQVFPLLGSLSFLEETLDLQHLLQGTNGTLFKRIKEHKKQF